MRPNRPQICQVASLGAKFTPARPILQPVAEKKKGHAERGAMSQGNGGKKCILLGKSRLEELWRNEYVTGRLLWGVDEGNVVFRLKFKWWISEGYDLFWEI
ncbi:hypothetical protein CEXT_358401 [Caerostris extrusa]|uniref:Uncharacterized protein n=1 Tax=Caerostris extrusa TaxID=172846 RepID=A0AAV4QL61_CAEEX|nr:hypothetical protein CEXT_358401 [Caerostris extrusa]